MTIVRHIAARYRTRLICLLSVYIKKSVIAKAQNITAKTQNKTTKAQNDRKSTEPPKREITTKDAKKLLRFSGYKFCISAVAKRRVKMKFLTTLVIILVMFALLEGVFAQDQKAISLVPSRVESDKNNDGKVDYWQFYSNGQLEKIEIDSDFDGTADEKIYFRDGKPYKGERDTDNDGVVDTWLYY